MNYFYKIGSSSISYDNREQKIILRDEHDIVRIAQALFERIIKAWQDGRPTCWNARGTAPGWRLYDEGVIIECYEEDNLRFVWFPEDDWEEIIQAYNKFAKQNKVESSYGRILPNGDFLWYDLNVLVLDRDVLGENRNAALALLVVGIQDAVLDLLVGTEGVRGTQELIDHRRLAVVDVGDDGDVPQIVYAHVVPLSSIHIQTARVCDPPSDATLSGNIEPFTENSFILAILDERGFLTCRFRVAPHKTIAGAHALIQHICRKTTLERGFEEAHEQSIVIAAVNLDAAGVADGIASDTAQALVLKTHLVLGDKVGGRLEARLFAILIERRQIAVGSGVLNCHDHARVFTGGKVIQERADQIAHHGVELGGDVTGVLHILCHL